MNHKEDYGAEPICFTFEENSLINYKYLKS
jgi:hypothetical protein